jgi:hypothetical protein
MSVATLPETSEATELALRVFDLVDSHRLDEMADLLTPDVDFINPLGRLSGRAAVVANFEPLKVGFPNSRHIFTNVAGAGDMVALEGEWTGTNSGPISTPVGEVTTGKTVRFPFGAILRLEDDEVAAVHIYHDLLIMFEQLGLGQSGQQYSRN